MTSDAPTPTERALENELQGHVFRRIKGHRSSTFVFVPHGDDGEPVRQVLHRLLGRNGSKPLVRSATDAEGDPKGVNVAVGLTSAAVAALDVEYRPLPVHNGTGNFNDPFVQGMPARAELLGDPKADAQKQWDGTEKGLLLWISAPKANHPDIETVRQLIKEVEPTAECHQEQGTWSARDTKKPDELLLGYADGTSQPYVPELAADENALVGGGTATTSGWKPVPLGEFVLGQLDAGQARETPTPAWLTRNGTFLVYRRYDLHRAAYEAWLADAAEKLAAITGQRPGDVDPALVAAKVMGRFRRLPPDDRKEFDSLLPDEAGNPTDNGFRFDADTTGFGCPIGSHIRRANPRDALGFDGELVERHRIIRRGAIEKTKDQDTQVLHFAAVNARIADGFEFIQRQWLNTGKTFRIGCEPDLFAGARPKDGRASVVIQGEFPAVVTSDEPISTLIGGDYFLMPSMSALRRIADQAGEDQR